MIARLMEKLDVWLRTRAVERELSELDDRQLNDLGIGRWQIPFIARASVAR